MSNDFYENIKNTFSFEKDIVDDHYLVIINNRATYLISKEAAIKFKNDIEKVIGNDG